MSGEHDKQKPFNSGVMVMNVSAWEAHFNGLVNTIDDVSGIDQWEGKAVLGR